MNHGWMIMSSADRRNTLANLGVDAREERAYQMHDYNLARAAHKNSKTKEWGDFITGVVHNTRGEVSTQTKFVPWESQDGNPKNPAIRSEYSGSDSRNIRGPVDNSF